MNSKLFDYVERHNVIYDLSGVTKLLCFLIASIAVIYSYDIRVVAIVFICSLIFLKLSGIKFSQIKLMVIYVAIYMAGNTILTYIFNPSYGVTLYGTEHILLGAGRYALRTEQILYQCTKVLKYCAVIPLSMIFLLTTNPSEMAASLNGVGIPYKITYALALTLRYFPDVIRDYQEISVAQQARGLDMSKKEKFSVRAKNVLNICVPLIFTTLDRVEIISNAMDLRGFGTQRKRTWYAKKPLKTSDYIAILICILLMGLSIYASVCINHSRYFNPFI